MSLKAWKLCFIAFGVVPDFEQETVKIPDTDLRYDIHNRHTSSLYNDLAENDPAK